MTTERCGKYREVDSYGDALNRCRLLMGHTEPCDNDDDTVQCDSCAKIVPEEETTHGFAYGLEGTFCAVCVSGRTTMITTNIEEIISNSFLSRVPEILQRGGFTFEQAVERAYYEDQELIARLSAAAHDRSVDNPYRKAVELLSDKVYTRLREEIRG